MKKHYTPILFIFCLLASCSYLKNVKLLSDGELGRSNFVQTLPFEWKKDIIVVKARLNADTTEREFIFDTGAFNSKVENNLANELGLETVTEKDNSTAQGVSQKIEVTRIDSIRFGETTFYNIGAGKVKYAETSASPCLADDGLIGANLIKLAHWKIDYPQQQLHFSDKAFKKEENSYTISFDRPLLSGTPKINLKVGGREIENLLFDVGYNGGLVLPLAFASKFESTQTKIILDKSTSGIYGTNVDSLVVKVLPIEIGGFKTEIPVEFSNLGKALLGNEFLKHFSVIINYEEKEIHLTPVKEVVVEQPRRFLLGIKNDSLWEVTRTAPDIPLNLGEEVRSINGQKPQEAFTSHCDYFMNIQQLFQEDTLNLEKPNGELIKLVLK